MIVCAIDDLLFSINISSAAKRQGVELYFERTPGRVVSSVREKRPWLLILDLKGVRLKPMEVVAALKADPSLSGVRTLGYVSHADTDTIGRGR